MKEQQILEVLGTVDEKYIEEAAPGQRSPKPLLWVRWVSLAACLCLVAGVLFALFRRTAAVPETGGGERGGSTDPAFYSVAVLPATEEKQDVAAAVVAPLTEANARDQPLAAHLPQTLPEGFHFGRGSLYQTSMKNGVEYDLLRVEYITGELPEQQCAADGGAIAPDLSSLGDTVIVCVMNFPPDTDRVVYASREEVPLSALEETEAADFQAGDCFVSVFPDTAGPEAAWSILAAIQ